MGHVTPSNQPDWSLFGLLVDSPGMQHTTLQFKESLRATQTCRQFAQFGSAGMPSPL